MAAEGKNSPAGSNANAASPEFVISRVLDAPPALVFKMWTDPKHMAQWWGPTGFTTPVCRLDVRPGGAYRVVMHSTDGVDYPMTGIYKEIVEPLRIVMTQDCSEHPAAWHDMVKADRDKSDSNPAGILLTTVTFEDVEGMTKLTIRTRFDSAAIRDAMLKMGMTEGWSLSLDRMRGHLMALGNDNAAGAADREITVTRLIDAPRELVFDAWTDPRHIVHWWGPNGFTLTIHEMDVRPGGAWRFIMHGPDGTDYQNKIVYIEVVRPERIAYAHVSAPFFKSMATFNEQDGKTAVTVRLVFSTAAERDETVKRFGAIEGLKQTLGRLATYVVRP